MAYKKPVANITLDFDLKTFKAQKEQLKQVAGAQVADKISAVKNLLKEIKELVELADLEITIAHEFESELQSIDELNPNWNSSSMYC